MGDGGGFQLPEATKGSRIKKPSIRADAFRGRSDYCYSFLAKKGGQRGEILLLQVRPAGELIAQRVLCLRKSGSGLLGGRAIGASD